jgi:hypothetical protein
MDCYIYTSVMSDDTNLESLMESFRKSNKVNGITGCLLFDKGNIIQLFEGPILKTRKLYSNILLDKRHYKINLLSHKEIIKRNLLDWNMKFVQDHTRPLGLLEELSFEKILLDSFKKSLDY